MLSAIAIILQQPSQAQATPQQHSISPSSVSAQPTTEEPPEEIEEIEETPDDLDNPNSSTSELPEEEQLLEDESGEEQNPFTSPSDNSLDTLIQKGFDADSWEQAKGDLPCAEATTECIAELQQLAASQNPLLQEVDARIEEISSKIEEAKANNKKSVNLSVLRPAARVFLEPTFSTQQNPGQSQQGTIEKIAQLFASPTGVINEVLKAVGIPLFDRFFGGSDQNQERAIKISDLQVKLAEIQRGRAELANQIKERVALALFDFDDSRREFQTSQEITRRESSRLQLFEIDYLSGQGDSSTFLGQLSSLDRHKAQTWRSWSKLRSQLEKVKLLVLGTEE